AGRAARGPAGPGGPGAGRAVARDGPVPGLRDAGPRLPGAPAVRPLRPRVLIQARFSGRAGGVGPRRVSSGGRGPPLPPAEAALMSDPVRVIMDSLAAVFLAMALLIVYGIDRSGRSARDPAASEEGNDLPVNIVTDESAKKDERAKKLNLVVVETFVGKDPRTGLPQYWDDMGKLLRELGKGYDHFTLVKNPDLINPKTLEGADILFLTCHPNQNPRYDLSETLRKFVAQGGTLYASDWRFDDLAAAFPDFVNREQAGEGVDGHILADGLDRGLQEALAEGVKNGSKLHLKFDLNRWKTAAFNRLPDKVNVMVRSQYKKMLHQNDKEGIASEAPLLVTFTHGKGTVIFTSFHNEKQTSEVE